jgi:hypothetical protein
MKIQSIQIAVEVGILLLQVVSTIGMEKHTSPIYTVKIAAEISFVNFVLTNETTQQNFQKTFAL